MADLYSDTGDTGVDLNAAGEAPAQGQAEEATPGAAAIQPQLSPTQVQQMIADALSQNNQLWSRQMQSQMDKRAAAVEANVLKRLEGSKAQADQVVKTAKESGLDDAAASALGQRFMVENINNLIAEAQQPPARNGQQQQAEPDEEQQQYIEQQQVAAYQAWITNQGDQIRDAFGLPYDAPEMRNIVTDQGEQEYFDSIKAAGRAYQQRIAKTQQPARPARVPGLGVDGASVDNNPIAKVENTSELYKMAAKQARQQGDRR